MTKKKDESTTTTPIDLFLCVHDPETLREEVVRAWSAIQEASQMPIKLTVLTPETVACDVVEFQRQRRIHAEIASKSDIYIVADADCLPIGANFVRMGVETLSLPGYASFTILSAMPVNANIYEWTPAPEDGFAGYQVMTDRRVMEHVDVGGIRFVRKGVMSEDPDEWPEMGLTAKYDRKQAEWIRSLGGRVGLFRAVKMEHLGETNPVKGNQA